MTFFKISKTKSKIILASGSRIRSELLTQAGIEFQVVTSNVNENLLKKELFGESISKQVTRLASEKALKVSKENPKAYVIGSDNMCTLDNKIFDKPIDHKDAINHLQALSGNKHLQNNANK